MKTYALPVVLASFVVCSGFSQASNRSSEKDQKTISEIKRLMDYELNLVLTQDTAAMEQFYPEDMVVTNPFNQLIDKRKVMERVKSDIIKYAAYQKQVDFFHLEGDQTVVVIGREIVVPTEDADRADAGHRVGRRFTEVWMKRGQAWKKVVRHANNVVEQ